MDMVLTLAGPAGQPLDEAVLEMVAAQLPAGNEVTRVQPHVADLTFQGPTDTDIDAALRDSSIDHCLQPLANRNKRLLLADMDSTMINVECIDELADFAGVREQVVAITERAMRGEIDFEGALIERARLLQGLPEAALAQCFDARVRLSPGARDLIQAAREAGIYCALVSGGFTYFTGRVAALCGFHEHRANSFIIENGHLTGDVARPILGQNAKVQALNELCAKLGITTEQAVTIGDGANDRGMIEAAGLGIAYHAKPVLRAAADARVDHGGLEAVRAFLGI